MKACNGKVSDWHKLLLFALTVDRTIHSIVTKDVPVELMFGEKSIMPIEEVVPIWSLLPLEDSLSKEELLSLRI